jgi:similar to stage IV sporulation protein
MLLGVANFFRGYVLIRVTGFSVERFINLVTYNQIYLWDIKRDEDGVILKVSIKGFKKLKKFARKTGCKIKILNKLGVPFKIYKYRKRKIFAAGLFFFIISLLILSSFIWQIDISGTERLNQDDILKFCEKNNFKIGSSKSKIDCKYIEKELLNNFSDISWINIKIKGTRALIEIKEIIPKQKVIDRNTPCDVIAKRDGLIEDIFVSSGSPKVKQKDVVKKGDVLASSEMIVENNNASSNELVKEYVHADAEVRAKTCYEMNFKIPYEYIEKKYTNKLRKGIRLELFNKKINLFIKNKFAYYDENSKVTQIKLTKDFLTPIKFFFVEQKEFVPIKKKRDIKYCEELADKVVSNKIICDLDTDIEVCDKKYEFKEENNGLKVNALIIILERIDEKVKKIF